VTRNNEEAATGLFAALAHEGRRDVLRFLRDRDYVRAGDIGTALAIGPSTLSGHLKVLRQAGLVESRRRGTEIQYRLRMSLVDEAILALMALRREQEAPGPDDPEHVSSPTDEREEPIR
jgi:ArsR family transcriptional regulator